MNANRLAHHRRSIRLATHDYSSPGAYFVTLCTHNRECLFGEIVDDEMRPNVFGRIVQSAWEDLPRHYSNVELDAFVVMPNHVHGIVVILANGEAEANPVGAGCEEAVVGAIHELPLRKPPSTSRARRRPMLLGRIIGRFKMTTAKSINLARGTTGVPVWQRNYYEHAIRDERDIQRIREYILANPARWAKDAEKASSIGR